MASAEQLPNGYAQGLARDVVAGDVDGRLRVRVAFDDLVHAAVDDPELQRIEALDSRDEIGLSDVLDRLRRLSVVAHVGAAPRGDRRRLAPARDSVVGVDTDDRVVTDRRLHLARPCVFTPRRNGDEENLATLDLHAFSTRRGSSPASVSGSQPSSVINTSSSI